MHHLSFLQDCAHMDLDYMIADVYNQQEDGRRTWRRYHRVLQGTLPLGIPRVRPEHHPVRIARQMRLHIPLCAVHADCFPIASPPEFDDATDFFPIL